MFRINTALYTTLVAFTLIWVFTDGVLFTEFQFFAWRAAFIQYTGFLAIATMSLAMVLALRPRFLEPIFDGLDKIYRLHKWFGISGLIFSVLHFLLANVPKLLVENGLLDAPEKPESPETTNAIIGFFIENRELAEEFGDWGFKIALVLIGIALIKRFPYRFFFWTHRLLAPLYLALAFHSLVLMEFSYWASPAGVLTAALLVAGSVAAVASLFGRVGKRTRYVGEVGRLEYSEENTILKVGLRMTDRWPGHEEGQFAFVTFDKYEGAHPFSIASSWNNDGFIAFFVKGLGDFTTKLPNTLKIGQSAVVEGPYGCFDFQSEKDHQVWIAGGIGIAPFASRLKALAEKPGTKKIDLFYSTSPSDSEGFIDRIRMASRQAGVTLHVIDPTQGERLDADGISKAVPGWRDADYWFCGPVSFGEALRNGLVSKGIRSANFHRELFEMR